LLSNKQPQLSFFHSKVNLNWLSFFCETTLWLRKYCACRTLDDMTQIGLCFFGVCVCVSFRQWGPQSPFRVNWDRESWVKTVLCLLKGPALLWSLGQFGGYHGGLWRGGSSGGL